MKSLSPLVALIIAVSITITVAIFVSSWYLSLVQSETGKAKKNTNVDCAYATINVDEVVYSPSTNEMKIRIRASGTVPVEIEKITVVNDSHVQVFENGKGFTLPILDPGDVNYVILKNLIPNVVEVDITPKGCELNTVYVKRDFFVIS